MKYDFEIALDLNEFDVRIFLRDSTDLFNKHLEKIKRTSYKNGYNTVCTFIEYGYPQEWKRILSNLWAYWNVKTFKQFSSRMEKLTSQDREQMIEEIAKAEIIAILRQQS